MHVFIQNGLNGFINRQELKILEIGIGTGLNALLTMEWCNSNKINVMYVGYEPHPLTEACFTQLRFNENLNPWIIPFHQAAWETQVTFSPYFSFEKRKYTWPDIKNMDRFDLIYFDAFGPDAQPEMWEHSALRACVDVMSPNAIWVTYSSKGSVRRNLEMLGLKMEKLPGPPFKRHMLRGLRQ
jgi:tRNA U34 5-methylaminomethyl-2-thiouridine-forming methyltransferase MnmC